MAKQSHYVAQPIRLICLIAQTRFTKRLCGLGLQKHGSKAIAKEMRGGGMTQYLETYRIYHPHGEQ